MYDFVRNIKEVILRLWEKIKDFFKRLFGSSSSVKGGTGTVYNLPQETKKEIKENKQEIVKAVNNGTVKPTGTVVKSPRAVQKSEPVRAIETVKRAAEQIAKMAEADTVRDVEEAKKLMGSIKNRAIATSVQQATGGEAKIGSENISLADATGAIDKAFETINADENSRDVNGQWAAETCDTAVTISADKIKDISDAANKYFKEVLGGIDDIAKTFQDDEMMKDASQHTGISIDELRKYGAGMIRELSAYCTKLSTTYTRVVILLNKNAASLNIRTRHYRLKPGTSIARGDNFRNHVRTLTSSDSDENDLKRYISKAGPNTKKVVDITSASEIW